VSLVTSVLKSGTTLNDLEQLEQLLSVLSPLLRDRDGYVPDVDEDGQQKAATEVFVNEQQLLAKLVHRIQNNDTDQLIKMYVAASKHFQDGGVQRIKHTMPPLVFGSLRLARKVRDREAAAAAEGAEVEAPQYSTRKVFHFILQITRAISAAKEFDMALKLFLLAAKAADECCFPQIAYELFKDAPILFETEIETEKSKVRALVDMIGTLLNCTNFTSDDYDIVTRKLCQYSGKRLKTIDRCRMVTLSSHLFWPPLNADGTSRFADDEETYQKSVECMKRAINIVRDEFNAGLFIEILNRYIYHFEQRNPAFEVKFLSGLIALINNQLQANSAGQQEPQVEVFYLNTLKYLRDKQADPEEKVRFGEIVL
jgi:vacuolar protein sorting-associated protein 35